jgi:lipoprotein-releasing system permease protein
MYGVVLKGVSGQAPSDTVSLGVTISRNFSEKSGLKEGDRMLTYFVGEKVAVRQFNVAGIYESVVETDDRHVVYASMSDLQRVNGWNEGQVSAIEISLAKGFTDESSVSSAADEIGTLINAYGSDDQEYVIATSSLSRYPQLFSWLDLIDFNVFFILMLMTVVAGFNMISGLLIMLFENISTIGLLKSLGMTDRGITGVFMSSSAILVGKGMAIGNALAIAFCILQDKTHLLRLDPENYYVSFVPVDLDLSDLLITDVVSFAVIMLLLLIPSLFISRVDPAETVRVR